MEEFSRSFRFPPDEKLFPRLRIATDKRKPPWNFRRENEGPAAHLLVKNVISLAHRHSHTIEKRLVRNTPKTIAQLRPNLPDAALTMCLTGGHC
jgi:hypothetical protein